MPETKKRRLQLVLGYLAFGLFSLVAGFFLTFPYDTLKERVRLEADQAGYFLRIASMGPGLLVRASDVQVSKKSDTVPAPEALRLDSVSFGSLGVSTVRVGVRGLGGTVTATLSGGAVNAWRSNAMRPRPDDGRFVTGRRRLSALIRDGVDETLSALASKSTQLQLDAEGLDLSKGNLKGFSGIDFAGTVDAHLDLSFPPVATDGPDVRSAVPDLSQASGTFSLVTKELTINGGNVSIVIPQYGPEPTPLDLPKVVLGDIVAKVKFDKGAATVEEFKAKGPDLEAAISGTMKLGKRLEYSEPNLEVRFKPDPEFQKRLGLIGGLLSMIGADPKDPSWRLGRLTGFLGRPQFR